MVLRRCCALLGRSRRSAAAVVRVTWRRSVRRVALAGTPPAVAEPALDRSHRRRALVAPPETGCEVGTDAADGFAACESSFRLLPQRGPCVRAGEPAIAGLRCSKQACESLVAPARKAAGRTPNVHEADGEVTPGSSRRKFSAPVHGAQPDAHAVWEVQLLSSPVTWPSADRTGRCLPESFPLVVADRHGPTVPCHRVTSHRPCVSIA